MTIKFLETNVILANVPTKNAIVNWMRNHDNIEGWFNERDYMQQFSERTGKMTNTIIRFDSADHFIDDLLANGFLKLI